MKLKKPLRASAALSEDDVRQFRHFFELLIAIDKQTRSKKITATQQAKTKITLKRGNIGSPTKRALSVLTMFLYNPLRYNLFTVNNHADA